MAQWNTYAHCGIHICSGIYANNVERMYTVFLVTWFVAVGSYEAYTPIVTYSKFR